VPSEAQPKSLRARLEEGVAELASWLHMLGGGERGEQADRTERRPTASGETGRELLARLICNHLF
jgi:hypothetical protein